MDGGWVLAPIILIDPPGRIEKKGCEEMNPLFFAEGGGNDFLPWAGSPFCISRYLYGPTTARLLSVLL
ncbi:hypothetical protein [Acidaminococcus timonensis]|uniref:hypothetical protein n=1 Tax=Acidaminococcus timonensis TaxID=1871002 RepID=UPI0008D9CD54|nr:hypothetical protein [Acidaminococcus timonensis]